MPGIDAIRQVVLNPDANDVPVFLHSFARALEIYLRQIGMRRENQGDEPAKTGKKNLLGGLIPAIMPPF